MVRLQVHAQFDNHALKTVEPFSLNIYFISTFKHIQHITFENKGCCVQMSRALYKKALLS